MAAKPTVLWNTEPQPLGLETPNLAWRYNDKKWPEEKYTDKRFDEIATSRPRKLVG